MLTLPEYMAATKPKPAKGVDPVRSAKVKAGISGSLRKARQFADHCAATVGPRAIPRPELEYHGVPGRKYRMDIAWPESMVCLEIEGGTWKGGRHDHAKANAAAIAGWRVLYCKPAELLKPETLALIQDAIHGPRPAGNEGER